MPIHHCPGATRFREPVLEALNCPYCGQETEIWGDEPFATCPGCGKNVMRNTTVSCLDWCKHAEECVGKSILEKYKKALKA